jgi:hypothetical protein
LQSASSSRLTAASLRAAKVRSSRHPGDERVAVADKDFDHVVLNEEARGERLRAAQIQSSGFTASCASAASVQCLIFRAHERRFILPRFQVVEIAFALVEEGMHIAQRMIARVEMHVLRDGDMREANRKRFPAVGEGTENVSGATADA